MNYIEVIIRIDDDPGFVADILADALSDVGFESFEPTSRGVKAYVPENLFDNTTLSETVANLSALYNCKITYSVRQIEDRNWNALWEQNSFTPILVEDRLAIYPSTHRGEYAEGGCKHLEYSIELNPKQSFGSGYHETTRMMLRFLLDAELGGLSVLDMGCGTAVLGILASKRGAGPVVAIDIDEWSVKNAKENAVLNNITGLKVIHGDARAIATAGIRYDIILANINRNILLRDLPLYYGALKPDGAIYVSGFYSADLAVLDGAASQLGLRRTDTKEDNDWAAARYEH